MEWDRQAGDAVYASQTLRATERAIERAALAIHEDFKRGLNQMIPIISIAPFIGILGTVRALAFDTFLGFNGDKLTGLAVVAEGLSRACVPAAIGLLVGLQSLWCTKYLRGRLAGFDLKWRIHH
jgi:biopolymer transport protein ExbB/TolQ